MNSTIQRWLWLIAVAGATVGQATIASTSALAIPFSKPPILLAQRANERIAVLQCGEFAITLRYVGYPGSDRFSYQTRGLFLNNGQMDGNDYVFYNSDHEYRVTINFANQYDTSGSGRLQVLHYGETILNKQCTWEN
jgi:hypothetical protein